MLVTGTVVLVLGVAFFVKYAFDNNWITETMRVGVGTLVGVLVWVAGLRLTASGYTVYGRVIAGGGLAMVYITAYAAHVLYELVSAAAAFVWMIGVSAVSAATADRQRSLGLALMAIVLAYFAPVLVGQGGSHLAFFAYELALAGLTLALTRRHGWPALGFASLYLALFTIGGWASRGYRPDLYVSTEIFFALTFVAFVAIVRAHTRSTPIAGIARFVLALLPVGFHLASLSVLYAHSVALLAYLVVATTIALAIPAVRASALLRLAVWAMVSLPFYSWLLEHTSSAWYIASLATAVGLYALHLITQFLTMSESGRPPNAEILLFHANGLSLFLFLYVVVDANAGSTARLAALLAVWNGVLALWHRERIVEIAGQALALSFALAATAISLQFVGPWVTVGWAAEGAAVIGVGLAMHRPFLRAGGFGLLAAAAFRLIAYQFFITLASHRPVLNMRVATAAFVIALLYGVAALYRRRSSSEAAERGPAMRVAIAAANAVTVLLMTAEIVSFWELQEGGLAVAFARQLSLSLAWAMYALGLIVLGFRRRSSLLRYLALSLFGITILKMFSVDLLELEGVYRIVGFVALGLMLLAASFLYQRSLARR
jgi:hypothetical protein